MRSVTGTVIISFLFSLSNAWAQVGDNTALNLVWHEASDAVFTRGFVLLAGVDIDQDGKGEFLTYEQDFGQKIVYLFEATADNNYEIIWQHQFSDGTLGLAGGERGIMVTDIDKDGFQEIVVIVDSENPATANGFDAGHIFEWDGTDNGIPSTPTATFDPPRDAADRVALEFNSLAMDLDNDGEVELVLQHRGGNGKLLTIIELTSSDLSIGVTMTVEFDENFTLPGTAADTARFQAKSTGFGITDVDQDGLKEIIMFDDLTGFVRVYEGTGTNTYAFVNQWQPSPTGWVSGATVKSLIPQADFDKDGVLELYLSDTKGNSWVITPGGDVATMLDDANWTRLIDWKVNNVFNEGGEIRGGILGDVDRDNKPDIYFAGNNFGSILDIEYDGGDVTVGSNYSYFVTAIDANDDVNGGHFARPINLQLTDMDNDGHLEILAIVPWTGSNPVDNLRGLYVLEHAAGSSVVTNLDDSGGGSLRAAIGFANTHAGPDSIVFEPSLSGGTMQPLSALPTLTDDSTTINGDIDGDGTPDIELDGTNAGAVNGIYITGSFNTIKGLVINRFGVDGILIDNGHNNLITGNYVGTNSSGTIAQGNGGQGINLLETWNNTIKNNLISGNVGRGILMQTAQNHSNAVIGNTIGTTAAGDAAIPNLGSGVEIIAGAHDNIIGGSAVNSRNVIAFNGDAGVRVESNSTLNNTITRNSIFKNDSLGINLSNGGNSDIIAPSLVEASYNRIVGTAPASSNVEVFADSAEEAKYFLGSVMADDFGTWVFEWEFPEGLNIAATATDPDGNTSEIGFLTDFVPDPPAQPVVANIPDITFPEDSTYTLDLDDYVTDSDTHDSLITWYFTLLDNGEMASLSGDEKFDVQEFLEQIKDESSKPKQSGDKISSGKNREIEGVMAIEALLGDVIIDELGITIDASTHVVTFSPLEDWSGAREIMFIAVDDQGLSGIDGMTATVSAVNDAPVLSQLPDLSFNEDDGSVKPLSDWFDSVDDVDDADSTLSWSVSGGDSVTALVSGDTVVFSSPLDWYGNDTLFVIVSDGVLSDSSDLFVVVESVNDVPVLAVMDTSFLEDEIFVWQLDPLVSDVDHADSQMTWSAKVLHEQESLIGTGSSSALASKMFIRTLSFSNQKNSILRIADGKDSEGANNIGRGKNAKAAQRVKTIRRVNTVGGENVSKSPVFKKIVNKSPRKSSAVGEATHGVEPIRVSVDNDTRLLTITTAANWNGSRYVVLTVVDDDGGSTADTILISVLSIGDAPVVNLLPGISFLEDLTHITLDLDDYVTDIDTKPADIIWTVKPEDTSGPVWIAISDLTHQVIFTADPDWYGQQIITFIALDPDSLWGSDSLLVVVSPVNDSPDAVQLILPATGNTTILSETTLFKWNSAFDPDLDDVINYTIQFNGTEEFPDNTINSVEVGEDTSIILTELPLDLGKIYWRIVAKDVAEAMSYSEIRSFDFVVSIRAEGELPSTFELAQNYPNPFNPVTTIEYSLPKMSKVLLVIYNLRGKEIVRLVDSQQQAGYHTVIWNASDVATGVYFYRLQTRDFVRTKKMIMLK